jgi:lipoprotein-anchoring transpeptidase ErfK/SrfK
LVPTLSTILTPCAFTQDNGTGLASTRVSRQIIVSIPDRKLVVMQNGAVLREFPIAVGANASPSPTGTFEIVNRLSDPTYYHAGIVLPPGADNPLGPRWVGLNQKGYGIHGTNAPGSIGKAASHGCIRLRNRDMVQFFALVHVGDTVEIHGARDEEIAAIFGSDTNAPVDIPASGGTAGGQ